MRCREARQRLIRLKGAAPEKGSDLARHLLDCPGCSLLARAEKILVSDLKAATIDDTTGTFPLSALKTRVEARADDLAGRHAKEFTVMGMLKKNPRLGLSIGIIVILLAAATLIPFSFDKTVGYEVAIAGVNRDLAMDEYKVQELLTALGVHDAEFVIDGCEATCQVTISDLKDEEAVKIVTIAFVEMGNCFVERIIPVEVHESGSLIFNAKNIVKFGNDHESAPEDAEIHQIVIARIDELKELHGDFNIWFGDPENNVTFGEDATACFDSLQLSDDNLFIHDSDHPGVLHATARVEETPEGETYLIVTTVDGDVHRINLADESADEHLKNLGIAVEYSIEDDHTIRKIYTCDQDPQAVLEFKGQMDAKHEAHKNAPHSGLPEGYELEQNYPNPFNPATTISYTLPEAEHVRLDIYNVTGQLVKTLVNDFTKAGQHQVRWDATDEDGARVASGIYMYRLTAGDKIESKTMTLLK